MKKKIALMMALTMLISLVAFALPQMASAADVKGTEVLVCVSQANGKTPELTEKSGKWYSSENSELGIHYVNEKTGMTWARYSEDKGTEMEVTANLPEAGKYEVYYFVSGHSGDTDAMLASIQHKGGEDEVKFGLRDASKKGFQKLGEYDFAEGAAKVTLKQSGSGFLRFSAIKFVNKAGTKGFIINSEAGATAPVVTPAPTTAVTTAPSVKVEGTEVVTCVVNQMGKNESVGIKETSGEWFGSGNKELAIHYVNPVNGATNARCGNSKDCGITVSTNLPEAGKYEVYYFVSGHSTDCSKVKITVNHKAGAEDVTINLKDASKKGFQKLGEFDFDAGMTSLSALGGEDGYLRFSAVKYVNKAGTKGLVLNPAPSEDVTVAPTPTKTPEVTPTKAPIATPEPEDNPFKDKFVDMKGHWAKDTVEKMVKAGVVNGTSETTFEPEGNVTRAEFTALMVRAMKYEAIPYEGQFEDVSADAWYAENVASMAKTGIIVGYDGKFNPEDNITHEEAVKILVAAYELKFGITDPGALATYFDDYFEISEWARPYIHKGVMISVAQGFEKKTEFKPLQKTTRAEAATMIYNLMNAVKVTEQF